MKNCTHCGIHVHIIWYSIEVGVETFVIVTKVSLCPNNHEYSCKYLLAKCARTKHELTLASCGGTCM